jgi:hypothetical protein
MGRNDRRHGGLTTMTHFAQHAIGDDLREATSTRRDTASADVNPAGITTTDRTVGTHAHNPGHPSATRCTATTTREHQCGGSPIHDVPTRPQVPQRSPPTSPRGVA